MEAHTFLYHSTTGSRFIEEKIGELIEYTTRITTYSDPLMRIGRGRHERPPRHLPVHNDLIGLLPQMDDFVR